MVSIFSAKLHSVQDFSVNLGYINGSLSKDNQKFIIDFCSALNVEIYFKEFEFDYQVKTSNLPIQAYIRLLWLDTFSEPFLWLDADTLALENWQQIYGNLDLESSGIVLCAALDTDVISKKIHLFPNNSAYTKGGTSYFNSGVFLGFPKNWRDKQFNLQWPDIASRHADLGFEHHDQDVLNYLAFESKKIIDASFNTLVMQKSLINQKILHFTGQPKPWHFDATSQNYFSSIELLKSKSGSGAFGGVNWIFEYQNYWRHEKALLDFFQANKSLLGRIEQGHASARKPLMARNDKLKNALLLAIGKKWISK
jgi:lipopolysaccharide biosynthesis glycosyltransferase